MTLLENQGRSGEFKEQIIANIAWKENGVFFLCKKMFSLIYTEAVK